VREVLTPYSIEERKEHPYFTTWSEGGTTPVRETGGKEEGPANPAITPPKGRGESRSKKGRGKKRS